MLIVLTIVRTIYHSVWHGSAYTVVKATSDSYGEGEIGGIRTPKPLNQLSQNFAWVITLEIWPSKPKFKPIAPVGASRKMGELSLSRGFYPRGARSARVIAITCVCLSVCVSHAGIVSKRLNVGSRKTPRDSPGNVVFLKPKLVGGRPPSPWNLRSK